MPKKNKKSNAGRKLFDGRDKNIVIQKLEEVWALGGTDGEAACYAGISKAALSDFLSKNKDISERKEQLLETPMLKARKTIVKALDVDLEHAWRFAKKRRPEEFGDKGIDLGNNNEGGFRLVLSTVPNDQSVEGKGS